MIRGRHSRCQGLFHASLTSYTLSDSSQRCGTGDGKRETGEGEEEEDGQAGDIPSGVYEYACMIAWNAAKHLKLLARCAHTQSAALLADWAVWVWIGHWLGV